MIESGFPGAHAAELATRSAVRSFEHSGFFQIIEKEPFDPVSVQHAGGD
jgi:hypothetical protein